jgi:hypothetical protein
MFKKQNNAHEKLEGYALLHFKGYASNVIDTSVKPDFIFIHASYRTLIFVEVLINPTVFIIKEKIDKYINHCDQLWFYIYSEDNRKFDELLNGHDRIRIYYYPEILNDIGLKTEDEKLG